MDLLSSDGSFARREVLADGMHLATYAGTSETYFAYTDWMGTERVRTDSADALSQTCSWSDFGNSPSCTTNTDPVGISPYGYAGYEYDAESGLHHMWFRDYNPRLGRFLTTDPYAGSINIGDPQSLNRYAYVGGNPVNYFDPLGLKCITIQGANGPIVADDGEQPPCDHPTGPPPGWTGDITVGELLPHWGRQVNEHCGRTQDGICVNDNRAAFVPMRREDLEVLTALAEVDEAIHFRMSRVIILGFLILSGTALQVGGAVTAVGGCTGVVTCIASVPVGTVVFAGGTFLTAQGIYYFKNGTLYDPKTFGPQRR